MDFSEKYLKEAMIEAKKAYLLGEVPVGAVIVYENKIISRAHNLREKLNDVTAHAETLAIKEANRILKNWRLKDCTMYVTLEPCPFCASLIGETRMKKLYIGIHDLEKGACGSVINILNNEYLKYNTEVNWMYDKECEKILLDFFKNIRNKNYKKINEI